MSGALRAGVARVEFEAALGGAMMGYGARQGGARARHDPLFARAVYLERSGATESGELLLVELDLCLLAPAHAEALRARIAERTGVAEARVGIGCIHTHSGPETGLFAALTGAGPPDDAPWLAAALRAAASARAGAEPARLGVGRAEARIGRNRRVAGGPLDPEVLVVRVERADRRPLAVLYIHGCHPTVLGHDNLEYSADWPGAASRAIEAALPGVIALFALGAHADIDPRTRGLHDLAVSGQSAGGSFASVEELGRELGTAVAAAADSIATRPDAPIATDTVWCRLPVHGGADPRAREAALAPSRARAQAALGLGADVDPGVPEWFGLIGERTAGLAPGEARPRIAAARAYLRDRTAPRFAGGLAPAVSVQVARLGDAWLLCLPLEATVDVGLDWKRRLGGAPGAVVSIANGWLRYLPHPRNFAEPDAEHAYEVLMSTFGPDAATHLLDAADALRARLGDAA